MTDGYVHTEFKRTPQVEKEWTRKGGMKKFINKNPAQIWAGFLFGQVGRNTQNLE